MTNPICAAPLKASSTGCAPAAPDATCPHLSVNSKPSITALTVGQRKELFRKSSKNYPLIPGNVNDVSIAPELIAAVDLAETEVVSADKGYDSDKLRAQIEEEGSKANIPYKRDREEKNRDMDWYLYKIRHLVENAFARLKH